MVLLVLGSPQNIMYTVYRYIVILNNRQNIVTFKIVILKMIGMKFELGYRGSLTALVHT